MTRSSWTLGTIYLGTPYARAARKHVGDNVVQVATDTTHDGAPVWRSATAIEATTFTTLPVAAYPF